MVEISGRPLSSLEEDARHYVRRRADDAVDSAMRLGLNVLLSAPRGMGATSLLHRLERDRGDNATYVDATTVTDAQVLLQHLADRLASGLTERALGTLRYGADALTAIRHRLEVRGAATGAPWWLLLDGPLNSVVAQRVFGEMRDVIFDLPLRWVVVASAERVGEYHAPPADVFFGHLVHLDGFPRRGLEDILASREVALSPERQRELLRLCDGAPRQLLSLARRALLEPDRALEDDGYQEWLQRQASLSQTATALFEQLQGEGSVTTADARRLGFSESRMRRALQELINEGLVRSSVGPADGPGRPPTVYRVAPGPPALWPETHLP